MKSRSQRFFFSSSKHCKEICHSVNDCSYPELQLFDSNCVKVCPYETSDSYREEPENTFTSGNFSPFCTTIATEKPKTVLGQKATRLRDVHYFSRFVRQADLFSPSDVGNFATNHFWPV
jgi:hypothetical protein